MTEWQKMMPLQRGLQINKQTWLEKQKNGDSVVLGERKKNWFLFNM